MSDSALRADIRGQLAGSDYGRLLATPWRLDLGPHLVDRGPGDLEHDDGPFLLLWREALQRLGLDGVEGRERLRQQFAAAGLLPQQQDEHELDCEETCRNLVLQLIENVLRRGQGWSPDGMGSSDGDAE